MQLNSNRTHNVMSPLAEGKSSMKAGRRKRLLLAVVGGYKEVQIKED